MAKPKADESAPVEPDHVEEPDNNPDLKADNAPHGRRAAGLN